jgi:CheY-like chemotaxis protein
VLTQTEPIEVLVLGELGDGLTAGGALPRLSANVTTAGTGQDAFDQIRRQGRHAASYRPALILLDLDEHAEQGLSLLHQIKGDAQFRRIPIIVLGAADSPAERARAYDLQANCYLPRPEDERHLGLLITRIEEFWLTRARLPAG